VVEKILRALHKGWIKSVSAFPFLELTGEPQEIQNISREEIKRAVSPNSARWLKIFDVLLGARGGIIWSGNWDQDNIPLNIEGRKKREGERTSVQSPKPLVVAVDRRGEILLLRGKDSLAEQVEKGQEKVEARVAFYHSEWIEKTEGRH